MNVTKLNRSGLNMSRLNASLLNASGIGAMGCKGKETMKDKIMESMVLWYDLKRQGATNESMAENPVLRDLSGNGHDATCYNFAWDGMSGIGGYGVTFTGNWVYDKTNLLFKEYTSTKAVLSNKEEGIRPTYFNLRYVAENAIQFTAKTNINCTFVVEHRHIDSTDVTYERQSIIANTPTKLTVAALDATMYKNRIAYFSGWWEKDGDTLEVELLPEYPNALVSDGVDDYAVVEGLPILTKERGYTIFANRTFVDLNKDGAVSSKSFNIGKGAFIFETDIKEKTVASYSFSRASVIPMQSGITYLKSTESNGITIKSGNELDDSTSMYLYTIRRNDTRLACIAIYSLLLFDRDLTTEEIDWVKTNLMNE